MRDVILVAISFASAAVVIALAKRLAEDPRTRNLAEKTARIALLMAVVIAGSLLFFSASGESFLLLATLALLSGLMFAYSITAFSRS